MKLFILIVLLPFFLFSQKNTDNVQALYDSLDKVYFFNSIELESINKYNFKPGEIPFYDNNTYENRIKTLASRSPFNYQYNSVVQRYITMYSKRIKSTGTLLALSELYFPLYEKYLNQYGLPLELKYLSIVESALNPTAVSPCGASGLWQFMYGTGKSYKLEINSYVDERFDPEKETIAACAYLKDLYKIYGQWDLAIAAYNCGPGNVNKGIKRAGGIKDFWAIYDFLPKETQGYVPAFIAASYICEFHEEHNIQKAKASFLFDDLDFIEINFNTSLKQLSYLLKIDFKKLKYLNPKFITGTIPGNNSLVVVPKEKALEWIDISIALKDGKKPFVTKDHVDVVLNTEKQLTIKEPQPAQNTNTVAVKKSPFGTYNSTYTQNKSSTEIKENKEVQDFNTAINLSKTYLCASHGNQLLTNGSTVTLRTMEDINYNGTIIPKNSLLLAKTEFHKESIVLKIISAKTPSNDLQVNFITEIFQKNNGKFLLDDGYSIMIRV